MSTYYQKVIYDCGCGQCNCKRELMIADNYQTDVFIKYDQQRPWEKLATFSDEDKEALKKLLFGDEGETIDISSQDYTAIKEFDIRIFKENG